MHWPRPPAQHLAERAADQIRNSSRIVHNGVPFRDRLEQTRGIKIHEHAGMRIGCRAMLVGRHQQHGKIVVKCNTGAGREIETARPHLAERERHAPGSGIGRRRHHRARRLRAACRQTEYVARDASHAAATRACRRPRRMRSSRLHWRAAVREFPRRSRHGQSVAVKPVAFTIGAQRSRSCLTCAAKASGVMVPRLQRALGETFDQFRRLQALRAASRSATCTIAAGVFAGRNHPSHSCRAMSG